MTSPDPRRIIFLDIDGVLNSHAYFEARRNRNEPDPDDLRGEPVYIEAFDPLAVARLNKIVAATNADVVVSSSWRIVHRLSAIRGFLNARDFKGRVIDKTPLSSGSPRGVEIGMWLYANQDVTRFVVLDDSGGMENVAAHFVQTSYALGLEDSHVERAIRILTHGP